MIQDGDLKKPGYTTADLKDSGNTLALSPDIKDKIEKKQRDFFGNMKTIALTLALYNVNAIFSMQNRIFVNRYNPYRATGNGSFNTCCCCTCMGMCMLVKQGCVGNG